MSFIGHARSAALAAILALATASAAMAAADTLQDCPGTKSRWSRALRQMDPARPDLVFVPVGGRRSDQERASNVTDVDVRVTCLEGVLSRIELRQLPGRESESLKPFLVLAATSLIAFDLGLAPAQASDMIATLRAEAESGRVAVSSWGLYEITYTRSGEGRAEFVIDHPEN